MAKKKAGSTKRKKAPKTKDLKARKDVKGGFAKMRMGIRRPLGITST